MLSFDYNTSTLERQSFQKPRSSNTSSMKFNLSPSSSLCLLSGFPCCLPLSSGARFRALHLPRPEMSSWVLHMTCGSDVSQSVEDVPPACKPRLGLGANLASPLTICEALINVLITTAPGIPLEIRHPNYYSSVNTKHWING